MSPSPPSLLPPLLPPNSWDSHMHVLPPLANYPLSPTASYAPTGTYTVHDAVEFASSLGIAKLVLVQPSIYGTDNAAVLDALRALGRERARGVVQFDPDDDDDDADGKWAERLREWHGLGVRGVRINLQSLIVGSEGKKGAEEQKREEEEARQFGDSLGPLLTRYINLLAPLAWIIQLYLPMRLISHLESTLATVLPANSPVRICIDHLGHPDLFSGLTPTSSSSPSTTDPGFAALLRLVEKGQTYVKLSAGYRISRTWRDGEAGYADLEGYVRALLRARGGERVVFASDWPHTRYEGLDVRPWVGQVVEWCREVGGEEMVERVFRGNAERLWGGL